MKKDNGGKDKNSIGEDSYKKLEAMDNKLDKIRSDTHNLNRINTLANKALILQEIKKIINGSETRAILLHIVKDEVKAGELADKAGIKKGNLKRDLDPFLDKGYITVRNQGNVRYYQRSELVDLLGFEKIKEYAQLIKTWEDKGLGASSTINTDSED